MQPVKNGLKSVVRTPGKSLLFLLILTVTATLLTISCCVFGTVRSYLKNCDTYFHTIAELEYVGQDYPSSDVYDERFAAAIDANRDTLSALLHAEPVLSWEPASAELAHEPQLHRYDTFVPKPNMAVLRVQIYSYDELQELYTAAVTESLYSRLDFTGKLIVIHWDDTIPLPECPGSYLVVGEFYYGQNASKFFQISNITFQDQGKTFELPGFLPADSDAETEALFLRYAETLHSVNDSCPVTYTAAIEDLYPFHQQLLTLIEGRYFTQAEYDGKAKVCVVSERLTGLLDKQLGDRISFSVLRSEGDLHISDHYTQIDEGDYEIVGIVNHNENYPFCVYLPDAGVEAVVRPVNGYTLGQFRLKNGSADELQELAAPLLEQHFRLNFYDQGFAAATEPMKELLFISAVFLAVCLLLALCVLALQSHLFISRQREAAQTMLALGSGRSHVCLYFLSAALTLLVPGAGLGACIGKQAESVVLRILKRFASQFADQDLRFSATRLAYTRTLEFKPVFSVHAFWAAAGLLTVATLLFTLFFALGCLKQKQTRVRKKRATSQHPKKTVKSSKLSGFFKYGLLSLRRGRTRTASVLLLGLAAALFFVKLTDSLAGYRNQLAQYKANAVITGSATDPLGKQLGGLVLFAPPVARLAASDLVTDCDFTTKLGNIRILGKVGGEQISFLWPDPYVFPDAYERVISEMAREPAWTGTSSVLHNPVFYYVQNCSVEWLEGWSDADFVRLEEEKNITDPFSGDSHYAPYWTGPAVCALSKNTMEAYGLVLGDEINAAVSFCFGNIGPNGMDSLCPVQLQVVACYDAPVDGDVVFSPLTYVRPGLEEQYLFPAPAQDAAQDSYRELGLSMSLSYSSFLFTLKDTTRLDELRSAIEEAGFTWVRSEDRAKNCIFLEDEIYLNTTHSMERQIQYVSVLYTALYLLAGIIGFVLAWLLLLSRRQEVAVMRALGTQPGRIVGNFLAEQFLLVLSGLGGGIALACLSSLSLRRTALLLCAAFLIIWSMSTLCCLLIGLKNQSFAALTEPE